MEKGLGPHDRQSVRNTALLVAACFFMELLDGTIVITAIPKISSSLRVFPGTTGLVVTAYLVTVAVLTATASVDGSRTTTPAR